jgi:hypothetical protein
MEGASIFNSVDALAQKARALLDFAVTQFLTLAKILGVVSDIISALYRNRPRTYIALHIIGLKCSEGVPEATSNLPRNQVGSCGLKTPVN